MFVRLGIAAVAIVGGVGYYYTDRALNYVEVPARIDGVERTCHLERTKHYGVARKREWTEDGDCSVAESDLANDSRMAGMAIKMSTKVTVRFTSPADNQVHTASYSFGGRDAQSKALTEGGVINILANTSKPERIQER